MILEIYLLPLFQYQQFQEDLTKRGNLTTQSIDKVSRRYEDHYLKAGIQLIQVIFRRMSLYDDFEGTIGGLFGVFTGKKLGGWPGGDFAWGLARLDIKS